MSESTPPISATPVRVLPLSYERQDAAAVELVRRFRRGLAWLSIGMLLMAAAPLVLALFENLMMGVLATSNHFILIFEAPWFAAWGIVTAGCWAVLSRPVCAAPPICAAVRWTMAGCFLLALAILVLGDLRLLRGFSRFSCIRLLRSASCPGLSGRWPPVGCDWAGWEFAPSCCCR